MNGESHNPLPWRMVTLGSAVTAVVIVTFVMWGGSIDAWMRGAVERCADDKLLVATILFCVLTSDILLPVPSSLSSTLCGILLGPFVGFLVSFAAMMFSSAIGYEIGVRCAWKARRVIGESDYRCLERLHAKGGRWLLIVLRPVPVLSEASSLFAGIACLHRGPAYFQLAAGNAIVSAVYVATGVFFGGREGSAALAFVVCMAFAAVCMIASAKARRS